MWSGLKEFILFQSLVVRIRRDEFLNMIRISSNESQCNYNSNFLSKVFGKGGGQICSLRSEHTMRRVQAIQF